MQRLREMLTGILKMRNEEKNRVTMCSVVFFNSNAKNVAGALKWLRDEDLGDGVSTVTFGKQTKQGHSISGQGQLSTMFVEYDSEATAQGIVQKVADRQGRSLQKGNTWRIHVREKVAKAEHFRAGNTGDEAVA